MERLFNYVEKNNRKACSLWGQLLIRVTSAKSDLRPAHRSNTPKADPVVSNSWHSCWQIFGWQPDVPPSANYQLTPKAADRAWLPIAMRG